MSYEQLDKTGEGKSRSGDSGAAQNMAQQAYERTSMNTSNTGGGQETAPAFRYSSSRTDSTANHTNRLEMG